MARTIPVRPAPPPAPADGRWRLARLLTAPHRLGFAAAALMLAASALWWSLVLAGRALGWALPWAVSPSLAHGLLMGAGFMPLFIVGFLFTAGPRWLGLGDVDARSLRDPVLALLAGWALALAGFHLDARVAATGTALVALGWGALGWRFARMLRASRAEDRLHATWIAIAGGIGTAALAWAAAGLGAGETAWVRAATQLLLWGFLAPVFVVVSHRMIPFFTASALPALQAWRPDALLGLLLGLTFFEAAVSVAEVLVGVPPTWRALQAAVELPAAVLLLWLAFRWGLVQSLKVRLLAMLHAGFAWFGLALLLAAASHALMAWTDGGRSLGLAPLHALTMGYLGCTLVAMITRVAAGHSGRALAADGIAWALYWTVQLATVLRVASAVWPEAPLLLPAAVAWTAGCVAWAWRYGGWLGRPRADGRPG